MAVRKEHPARSLLEPTGAEVLRRALGRLRANGLSEAEAGAELVRANFYDYVDAEREVQSRASPRLRIIKR